MSFKLTNKNTPEHTKIDAKKSQLSLSYIKNQYTKIASKKPFSPFARLVKNRIFKGLLGAVLIIFILLVTVSPNAPVWRSLFGIGDKVRANVNGTYIYDKDVQNVAKNFKLLKSGIENAENPNLLSDEEYALQELILNAGLKQDAKKHGVVVTEAEADKFLDFRYKASGSKEAYYGDLRKGGIDTKGMEIVNENEVYKAKLKDKILLYMDLEMVTIRWDNVPEQLRKASEEKAVKTLKEVFLPMFEAKTPWKEIASRAEVNEFTSSEQIEALDKAGRFIDVQNMPTAATTMKSFDATENFFNTFPQDPKYGSFENTNKKVLELKKAGDHTGLFRAGSGTNTIIRASKISEGKFIGWEDYISSLQKPNNWWGFFGNSSFLGKMEDKLLSPYIPKVVEAKHNPAGDPSNDHTGATGSCAGHTATIWFKIRNQFGLFIRTVEINRVPSGSTNCAYQFHERTPWNANNTNFLQLNCNRGEWNLHFTGTGGGIMPDAYDQGYIIDTFSYGLRYRPISPWSTGVNGSARVTNLMFNVAYLYPYPYPTPYQYPTPAYQYPTPAYQYPTPVYQYPTPVYQYPTPVLPQTCVLWADNASIASGTSTNLRWTTANNPTSAVLNPGNITSVTYASSGNSYGVSPTSTTLYQLTVRKTGSLDFTCSTTVTVTYLPTVCYTNRTASIGEVVSFTSANGNGSYVWGAIGGTTTAGSPGNTFSTSYLLDGTYSVTVTSALTAATCTVTVGTKQYFKIYNSDITAGFTKCTGWTDAVTNGRILGFNDGAGKGSGVQLAAFALLSSVTPTDAIVEFTSATGRVSTAIPAPPKGLTFANTAGTYGSSYKAGFCPPDYFDNGKNLTDNINAATVNIGNKPSGIYKKAGNLTLDAGGGLGASSIDPGKKIVLYVDGDVFIKNNVTYNGPWSNVANIPSFALVVRGNIYISSLVSSIDGFYVAQPTNVITGTKGQVYTCSALLGFAGPTSLELNSTCKTQLKINGSITAKRIRLLRTIGTLSSSSNAEDRNSLTTAEQFIFGPEVWLNPALNNTSGASQYDSISTVPPIL